VSHERITWLALSGGLVFGVSYGVALLTSTLLVLSGDPDPNDTIGNDIACDRACKQQAALFAVPVVGPLLSIESGPHRANDTTLALAWTGVEAAGVAMLAAGLIGHDVRRAPVAAGPLARAILLPVVTPDGGMVSLRTRW
jgi:hypothetical protein